MANFWKHVNQVLRESEIIIEVLDARMIEETRNKEIESKVKKNGKKLLYVLNKCDLVNKNNLKKLKNSYNLYPSVFISSKEKFGTTILKKKILELSKGKKVVVGILGYPNVGKSSLINALSGKGSARTSSESGYTKGLQKIRVDNKILLLDTPGVLPRKEKDMFKHSKIGALSYEKIKDPETMALNLINEKINLIKKHYHIKGDDAEEILEQIALKFNQLSKGNRPNLNTASILLLKDWQTGKIK